VTYRRGDIVVEAVRGVSLSVSTGEFVAIEGPSGSGKSTLLRAMAGLQPITSGSVHVDGVSIHDRSDTQLAELRRRHVGFIHQLFNLLPDLSAAENVGLPLLLDGVYQREVDERVTAVLDRLGIESLRRQRPDELSGGEMLRVAIARALVIEPIVILADEPTGSLDRANVKNVLEIFGQLHDVGGVTLVVVTHDSAVAAGSARRLRIVDGRLE
jgi:putative ABC transport system ATP-binding protein